MSLIVTDDDLSLISKELAAKYVVSHRRPKQPHEPIGAVNREPASEGRTPILIRMSQVKPEDVRWLWERRLARGKLSLLVGDPGVGKSFVSLDIASHVSNGKPWPDGGARCAGGSVILLSAEDGIADTLRIRLAALGADLDRISVLKAIKTNEGEIPFNLEQDLRLLERVIQKVRPLLIVVDPISAYMGSTNTHRDADVRRVLVPLVALAEKYGVAVLGIMHMNKSEAAAIYRASGSVAFVALARTAHVVAPDRHDPTRRIFASLKNNLSQHAESLAFRIDADGRGAKLKWENQPVRVNVAELLAVDTPRQTRPTTSKFERAVELLDEMLRNGAPVPVEEIKARAEAEGIGYRTLQRAYEELGGREAERHGFGGKPFWSLPISTTTDDQNVQPLGRE